MLYVLFGDIGLKRPVVPENTALPIRHELAVAWSFLQELLWLEQHRYRCAAHAGAREGHMGRGEVIQDLGLLGAVVAGPMGGDGDVQVSA